ncbi:MAG: serine protease [Acidimicrobiia bacterium]|nr:serine protease [Acidimicrobiia bacterium]
MSDSTLQPAAPAGRAAPRRWAIFLWLSVLAGSVAVGLLLVGLVLSTPGARTEQLSQQERIDLHARAQIATVRVAARACPGVIHGSGFVIDGLLFTSGHIAANDQRLKVDRPGRPVESPVMATSVSLDVAVADAFGLVAVEMVLAETDVPEGETVFVAGFPDGGELETAQARIVGYGDAVQWGVQGRRVMLIEPGIVSGFSGGPVMDRDGTLIGMLAGVDSVTGLAVAIPGDELGAVVNLAVETWTGADGARDGVGSVAHTAQPCSS